MLLLMFTVLSYALPLIAHRVLALPILSPITFLLFFFNVNYGFHTLNPDILRLSNTVGSQVHDMYASGVLVANIMLTAGMIVFSVIARPYLTPRRFTKIHSDTIADDLLISPMKLFIICVGYSAVFYLLDGPTAPRLTEILKYLMGSSVFSYNEIRREVFAGSLVESAAMYTRQTSSALLIVFSFLSTFNRPLKTRLLLIVGGVIVFITSSLQMNKFPIMYAFVTTFLAINIYGSGRVNLKSLHVILFATAAVLVISLMQFLYFVQYKDALDSGILADDDLYNVLFYRIGVTQADALRFWYMEFPNETPFLGLANVGLAANALGLDYFNVTAYIPMKYDGAETTYQVGFMGSGYASYGFTGLAAYAFIAGGLGVGVTRIVLWLNSHALRVALLAVCCMNMYFINSREFSTALLSGGVLLAPIIAIIYDRILIPRLKVKPE